MTESLPEPTATTTDVPAPADTPIQLNVAVMKLSTADNTFEPLLDGGILTDQDRYGIYFAPLGEAASVYVIQQDSTDRPPAVLFPNPQYHTASNPVAADQAIWLPGGGITTWWKTDDILDREKIIVLAIRERDEELEEAILNLGALEDNYGLTAEERELVESTVASQVDSLFNLTALPGETETMATRPVPRTPDGQNIDVAALVLQGGPEAFNYQIEFDTRSSSSNSEPE
jgi:hypothetical protein